ncbi:MAG: winged helix DNA-binding domain-containing protein [Acidimicrobiales bacterium]
MLRVDRSQVLAFRLAAHNLIQRLPHRRLVEAARPVGVQDSRVESAALALAARVDGVDAADVAKDRTQTKALLTVWAMRGALCVIGPKDAAVFTIGALPTDRESFTTFLGGWAAPIAAAALSPFDLLDQMARAGAQLLDGRHLPVDDLRNAIYDRVPALHRLERPRGARADMPEALFRALGLTGTVCITAGEGTNAMIGRTDQWLGVIPPTMEPRRARAELARRFLRGYGPAPASAFAEWTGRSRRDAREAFALVADELVEVDAGGTTAWVLDADLEALRFPPLPGGVRLLPPLDPFLQQRDRATLVPDPAARKHVWRPVGPPGVVIADGQAVGTWRGQRKGGRLEITVEAFASLADRTRKEIAGEADLVATARSCRDAVVTFC